MLIKLKSIPFIICIIIINTYIYSQNAYIDSLNLAFKSAKHDTTKIIILAQLSESCEINEILKYTDPCIELCEKAIASKRSNKKFYVKYLADALNNKGFFIEKEGDIIKALEYYQRSLQLREEIADKNGIANSLNNIGAVYDNLGNTPKALDYYSQSLKLLEEIGDKKGTAYSLNNMAVIYARLSDFYKAKEYNEKSLKIRQEIGDKKGIALSLNNIGVIYETQHNIPQALDYYGQSLKIREELDDKKGIASSLNNFGIIYKNQNDIPKALDYFNRSLKIQEEIGDKKGIAKSLNNIGQLYVNQKKYDQALSFCLRSMQMSKDLGYPLNIRNTALTLKQIYEAKGNYKLAIENYELYVTMNDSLDNETTRKSTVKQQLKYEFEKQLAADSVKHAEEQKVNEAQLAAQEAQIKQEKTKSYALYAGLALVVVFAGFMYNRFKITQKQKQIIELKEQEAQKQNSIITEQKHLVEEKHREITDSINYAERIQRSFLATKEQLDEQLKDYFVLFQPKDVVSGDFYWAHTLQNGNFALVTADSTGHGVPGAIMSLLNTSSLEKAVESGITEPSEILNHTRQTIIQRLKKDGSAEGGKDGMDCSLVSLNKDKTKLTYAAANNPIWIVRNVSSSEVENKKELIELKPDKMPVGKHDKDTISFTQHTIELQKQDVIYTLTDGFPDQFGGPAGKKFMYKKLKELLISISQQPLPQQHQVLKTMLKEWMGNNEQVDDITIIGVRV